MGVVKNIDYNHYPLQSNVGKRVKVCYGYDPSKYHYGIIVRNDIEEPGETIIKLDNGRYLRAAECQYCLDN